MTAAATPAEREALAEMHRLFHDARGDHPALASARMAIAAEIDSLVGSLRTAGVDIDRLYDEIDGARSPQPEIARQQAETIAELQRLLPLASMRNWATRSGSSWEVTCPGLGQRTDVVASFPYKGDARAENDARLVVAIRNALPDLLAVWALLADSTTVHPVVDAARHLLDNDAHRNDAGDCVDCGTPPSREHAADCLFLPLIRALADGATPAEDDQPKDQP